MEIKAKNVWFRARAKATGKLVEGYFVMRYMPLYSRDQSAIVGQKAVPHIFNNKGHHEYAAWTEIDISTLELIEQLTLFDD